MVSLLTTSDVTHVDALSGALVASGSCEG